MPYCQIKREYILLKTLKDTEKVQKFLYPENYRGTYTTVSENGLKFFNTLKS